jgi:hypothetical protein
MPGINSNLNKKSFINFLKNSIKSRCYMWSELLLFRNHLSFFIGKGVYAKGCNPFSRIKQQWGFSYILSKQGINRASADAGFMFIA